MYSTRPPVDNRDVFKQRETGWSFPHLPNPIHRMLATSSLDLPNALYPIPMAFNYNANNSDFHSSSSTHRGPSARRRFPEVVLNNGEPNPSSSTNRRDLDTRPGYIVNSPRNPRVEASFCKSGRSSLINRCHKCESSDPVSPVTSYAASIPMQRDSLYWQSHQPITNRGP